MTSKERVLTALNHQEPDRIPLDIGSINNTTLHHSIQTALKKRLGLKDSEAVIKARCQGVVIPDESLMEYFGADFRSVYINETRPWVERGDGTFVDMWNIGQKLNPDGLYYNMCSHPLENAETVEDIMEYSFPEPNEYMLEGLDSFIRENQDKCLVLEGLREPMFGLPSWLRGITNFYMGLVTDDGLHEALLGRILEYYKKLVDFLMERIGADIDIVKFADDMGSQTSLIMSPQTYREKIKPFQSELYNYVKEKYDVKILLHSCGSIRPIIADIIEIGVDALNPVQISATDMEPASLKQEFGDFLTFWGGGIDTQDVLQNRSPAEVKRQVRQNIGCFRKNGGYIFSQVHNIMPGVPIDNILAMYEAFQEEAAY